MKFIYVLMMFCLLSHIPARAVSQTACMQTFSEIRETVKQMNLKVDRKVESNMEVMKIFDNIYRNRTSIGEEPLFTLPLFFTGFSTIIALVFGMDTTSSAILITGTAGTTFALTLYYDILKHRDVKQGVVKEAWLDVLDNLELSEKELIEVKKSNALRKLYLLPKITEEFLLGYEEFLLHYYVEQLSSLGSVEGFLSQRQRDFKESLEEEISGFVESQRNRIKRGRHTPSKSEQYDSLSKQKFEETKQRIMSNLQESGLSKEEARIVISEELRSHRNIINSYVQFVSERVGFSKEETQRFAQIMANHLDSERL